jgi:5'-nucleotidase
MQSLLILHFNDAYHLEAIDGVGGAASFTTELKKYHDQNPLIIFGGDLFSPSMLSTATRGKHMTRIMNHLGVHYSVIGNKTFKI